MTERKRRRLYQPKEEWSELQKAGWASKRKLYGTIQPDEVEEIKKYVAQAAEESMTDFYSELLRAAGTEHGLGQPEIDKRLQTLGRAIKKRNFGTIPDLIPGFPNLPEAWARRDEELTEERKGAAHNYVSSANPEDEYVWVPGAEPPKPSAPPLQTPSGPDLRDVLNQRNYSGMFPAANFSTRAPSFQSTGQEYGGLELPFGVTVRPGVEGFNAPGPLFHPLYSPKPVQTPPLAPQSLPESILPPEEELEDWQTFYVQQANEMATVNDFPVPQGGSVGSMRARTQRVSTHGGKPADIIRAFAASNPGHPAGNLTPQQYMTYAHELRQIKPKDAVIYPNEILLYGAGRAGGQIPGVEEQQLVRDFGHYGYSIAELREQHKASGTNIPFRQWARQRFAAASSIKKDEYGRDITPAQAETTGAGKAIRIAGQQWAKKQGWTSETRPMFTREGGLPTAAETELQTFVPAEGGRGWEFSSSLDTEDKLLKAGKRAQQMQYEEHRILNARGELVSRAAPGVLRAPSEVIGPETPGFKARGIVAPLMLLSSDVLAEGTAIPGELLQTGFMEKRMVRRYTQEEIGPELPEVGKTWQTGQGEKVVLAPGMTPITTHGAQSVQVVGVEHEGSDVVVTMAARHRLMDVASLKGQGLKALPQDLSTAEREHVYSGMPEQIYGRRREEYTIAYGKIPEAIPYMYWMGNPERAYGHLAATFGQLSPEERTAWRRHGIGFTELSSDDPNFSSEYQAGYRSFMEKFNWGQMPELSRSLATEFSEVVVPEYSRDVQLGVTIHDTELPIYEDVLDMSTKQYVPGQPGVARYMTKPVKALALPAAFMGVRPEDMGGSDPLDPRKGYVSPESMARIAEVNPELHRQLLVDNTRMASGAAHIMAAAAATEHGQPTSGMVVDQAIARDIMLSATGLARQRYAKHLGVDDPSSITSSIPMPFINRAVFDVMSRHERFKDQYISAGATTIAPLGDLGYLRQEGVFEDTSADVLERGLRTYIEAQASDDPEAQKSGQEGLEMVANAQREAAVSQRLMRSGSGAYSRRARNLRVRAHEGLKANEVGMNAAMWARMYGYNPGDDEYEGFVEALKAGRIGDLRVLAERNPSAGKDPQFFHGVVMEERFGRDAAHGVYMGSMNVQSRGTDFDGDLELLIAEGQVIFDKESGLFSIKHGKRARVARSEEVQRRARYQHEVNQRADLRRSMEAKDLGRWGGHTITPQLLGEISDLTERSKNRVGQTYNALTYKAAAMDSSDVDMLKQIFYGLHQTPKSGSEEGERFLSALTTGTLAGMYKIPGLSNETYVQNESGLPGLTGLYLHSLSNAARAREFESPQAQEALGRLFFTEEQRPAGEHILAGMRSGEIDPQTGMRQALQLMGKDQTAAISQTQIGQMLGARLISAEVNAWKRTRDQIIEGKSELTPTEERRHASLGATFPGLSRQELGGLTDEQIEAAVARRGIPGIPREELERMQLLREAQELYKTFKSPKTEEIDSEGQGARRPDVSPYIKNAMRQREMVASGRVSQMNVGHYFGEQLSQALEQLGMQETIKAPIPVLTPDPATFQTPQPTPAPAPVSTPATQPGSVPDTFAGFNVRQRSDLVSLSGESIHAQTYNGEILFNPDLAAEKFRQSAYDRPRIQGVKPVGKFLQDEQAAQYFSLAHEASHLLTSGQQNPADKENQANMAALLAMGYTQGQVAEHYGITEDELRGKLGGVIKIGEIIARKQPYTGSLADLTSATTATTPVAAATAQPAQVATPAPTLMSPTTPARQPAPGITAQHSGGNRQWNAFQAAMAGSGLKRDDLTALYRLWSGGTRREFEETARSMGVPDKTITQAIATKKQTGGVWIRPSKRSAIPTVTAGAGGGSPPPTPPGGGGPPPNPPGGGGSPPPPDEPPDNPENRGPEKGTNEWAVARVADIVRDMSQESTIYVPGPNDTLVPIQRRAGIYDVKSEQALRGYLRDPQDSPISEEQGLELQTGWLMGSGHLPIATPGQQAVATRGVRAMGAYQVISQQHARASEVRRLKEQYPGAAGEINQMMEEHFGQQWENQVAAVGELVQQATGIFSSPARRTEVSAAKARLEEQVPLQLAAEQRTAVADLIRKAVQGQEPTIPENLPPIMTGFLEDVVGRRASVKRVQSMLGRREFEIAPEEANALVGQYQARQASGRSSYFQRALAMAIDPQTSRDAIAQLVSGARQTLDQTDTRRVMRLASGKMTAGAARELFALSDISDGDDLDKYEAMLTARRDTARQEAQAQREATRQERAQRTAQVREQQQRARRESRQYERQARVLSQYLLSGASEADIKTSLYGAGWIDEDNADDPTNQVMNRLIQAAKEGPITGEQLQEIATSIGEGGADAVRQLVGRVDLGQRVQRMGGWGVVTKQRQSWLKRQQVLKEAVATAQNNPTALARLGPETARLAQEGAQLQEVGQLSPLQTAQAMGMAVVAGGAKATTSATDAASDAENITRLSAAFAKSLEQVVPRMQQLAPAIQTIIEKVAAGRSITPEEKHALTRYGTMSAQLARGLSKGVTQVGKMGLEELEELSATAQSNLGAVAGVEIKPDVQERFMHLASKVFSPFSLEQAIIRGSWRAMAAPVFDQYIPAAAQYGQSIYQASNIIGGYTGEAPGGAMGGMMRLQANQAASLVAAGDTGYRAWGGLLNNYGAPLKQAQSLFGPALGAGMATFGGLRVLGSVMDVAGMTSAAGPLGLAVGGLAALYGAGSYATSLADQTPGSAMQLASFADNPDNFWNSMKAAAGTAGYQLRNMSDWITGKRQSLPWIFEAAEQTAQAALYGQQIRGSSLATLNPSERAARISNDIENLRKGDQFSAYTPEQVSSAYSQVMLYNPQYTKLTQAQLVSGEAGEQFRRELQRTIAEGGYEQRVQAAQGFGLGITGLGQISDLTYGMSGNQQLLFYSNANQLSALARLRGGGDQLAQAAAISAKSGNEITGEQSRMLEMLAQGNSWAWSEYGRSTGQEQYITESAYGGAGRGTKSTYGIGVNWNNQRLVDRARGLLAGGYYGGTAMPYQFDEQGGMYYAQLGEGAYGITGGQQVEFTQIGLRNEQTRLQQESLKRQQEWERQDFARNYAAVTGRRMDGAEAQTEAERLYSAGGKVSFTLGNKQYNVTDYAGQAMTGRGQWMFQDWQRTLQWAYQDQGAQLEWRGIQLQDQNWQESYKRSKEQYEWERRTGQRDQAIQYERQMTQIGWNRADLAYGQNRAELSYAWSMEDIREGLKYATGRDRRQLLKRQERETISYAMEQGQRDEQGRRIDQQEQWAKDDFARQKEAFETRMRWQKEELEQSKRSHEAEMALRKEQFQLEQQYRAQSRQLELEQEKIERRVYEAEQKRAKEQLEWSQQLAQRMNQIAHLTTILSDAMGDAVGESAGMVRNLSSASSSMSTLIRTLNTAANQIARQISQRPYAR